MNPVSPADVPIHTLPSGVAAIDRGIDALNGAIKEVRDLSHELRPRILDDLGLTTALTSLGNRFQERTGITVSVESSSPDTLKPEANTALYRIAQEALANVERHAEASQVSIRIWSTKARVRMLIADNGIGFTRKPANESQTYSGGLGLRNMQERMAHFRGILIVQTNEHGTALTAMFPKSANATTPAKAA